MARFDIEDDTERERTWNDIHKGLTVVINCHDEWYERHAQAKGLAARDVILTRIMHIIKQLPTDWQFGLWRALETLHGTFDWMNYDEEAVAIQEYKFSATIWFFEMGLLEIALGWLQGRSTAELALDAEQSWLGNADNSEEEQTALEDFAVSMRRWGRKALLGFGGEGKN